MKIFRHKNMMGLIYSILIAIPFLSVLGRTAYVVCNKNAKDSYSANTYKTLEPIYYQSNDVTTAYDYLLGHVYFYSNNVTETLQQTDFKINVDVDFFKTQLPEYSSYDITTLYIYETLSGGEYRYYYYIRHLVNDVSQIAYVNLKMKPTYFVVTGFENQQNIPQDFINRTENASNKFVKEYVEVTQNDTLDNAFDYSISRFVDDNNWGTLNFFSWFDSLFININANNNALYMHFINWYMNYTLFVSCAYILFLVIMWFINFARRLLERGMNYDW